MNQVFNPEEWLNTKKKGISGKVPRSDFIAKMKELGATIEELKKDKNQLTTKNKELEQKLTTSQTELTNRDQIIRDKDKESKEKEQELTAKLEEQTKILQNKEEELKNLQQRPDITNENYQELLDNQEKHRPEELRPENLPTDWEQQLEEKMSIKEKMSTMEEKFLELSAKQKDFLEIKAKLTEIEQRPTFEELKKAVQQEQERFKDYDNIKTELETVREKLQSKVNKPKENIISETEYQELNQQLQTEKEKNKILAEKLSVLPSPISINEESIIKEVREIINSVINPLHLEITELLKKQSNSQLNHTSTELPVDYEATKIEKEELLRILKTLSLKLPE